MISKEKAYLKIQELVARFGEQIDSYKQADYNETLTRRDFIDPFFKALGWDVDNSQGYAEAYREVIHEDKVKVGKATKAPDYSFRLPGGKRLFFVEAKKPNIDIKNNISVAYQIRRYGWSAKLPVSIITDFEEFAVYDCTKKPKPTDKSGIARIKYIKFTDYLKEFDYLWDTFSKERVLKGSFDKYIKSDTVKKGTATVDKDFLASLDNWRTYLATSISLRNKELDEDEINYAVQLTIDRLIFLRIAEDRGVEQYGQLKTSVNQKGDAYQNLFSNFKKADDKYNSGLFDFKKDVISETLKIDNKIIKNIVNEMYYPESPYEFSVISVEILGSAYEQFLGKVIRITPAHQAKIEEKPEVRKAGGVYYTPQYVVDYIVKNTVGKLIDGKSPKQIEKIKVCDPACGSGSFLIGAYQYLLDHYKNYYYSFFEKYSKDAANNKLVDWDRKKAIRERNKLPLTPDGELDTHLRKEILLNHIFGVDIDTNAVEVTKLSLLLKCMEGITVASIQKLDFKERVLPTLENNIKSGNSLVNVDFYDSVIDFGEEKKVKPFNWQKAFSEVFEQGGFNAIIGNPPYGAVFDEFLKQYIISHFKTVEGRYDNFELFIEQGLKLLTKDGLLGFIIPSPFLTNLYSRKLRQHILSNCSLKEIANFSIPVFEDPTVHTCIIIVGPEKQTKNNIKIKNDIDSVEGLFSEDSFEIKREEILNNSNFVIDIFVNPIAKNIVNKLETFSKSLGEICFIRQCIKTGNDKDFVISSDVLLQEPWKKTLRGKSISRFGTSEKNVYLKYGEWLARNWKNKSFYETNKIAIRETGKRITATLDLEKRYFLSSLYAIYFKEPRLNNEDELKFLLGVLNSNIANYYIKLIALNLTEGAFTKVRTNQLARLPIINSGKKDYTSEKNEIINLVDLLLSLNNEKSETKLDSKINQIENKIDYCENKINQLVYQLYELTPDEIKIVEESVS